MFEDSILENSGKGKKATTVMVSTIVHFGLLGVLILIPLIFTEQLEAAKYLVALTAPPPAPSTPTSCRTNGAVKTGSGQGCAGRSWSDRGTDRNPETDRAYR